MRTETTAPLTLPFRKGRVAVADGYGIRVFVQRRHLVVEDGLGRNRRNRVYSRATHGLSRLVVVGRHGFITLEAIRWLTDLGIPLLQVDRDGRVLAASSAGQADARLHRLQALAPFNPSGLMVARTLLRAKIAGQRRVLGDLQPTAEMVSAFDSCARALESAQTVDELVLAERDAAITYWGAWANTVISFVKADARAVPEHWLHFGQRGSSLTAAPRLAINPANALLNYLYALLEAETRIACLTVGLDPGLGIVHVDYRTRDSFVLDLMEAGRADVDAFVLNVLRTRRFTRNDFGETRRGICRILKPLSDQLSETADQWGLVIAPTVEAVAAQLADAPGSRISESRTPLTRAKRRRRPDAPKRHVVRFPAPASPKEVAACKRCRDPVPRSGRIYCDDCLPHYQREQYAEAFHGSGLNAIEQRKQRGDDPTHGAAAAERRASANVRRKAEVREWDQRFGKLTDISAFERDILPTIQAVPLSRLVKATGLSLRYCSQIRRGERTPHPRHWEAFISVGTE